MTALGKIMVVANFAFSVAVACWALAFYFSSVDWTDNNPDSPATFDAYVSKKKSERGDSGTVMPVDREATYDDPLVGRMVGRVGRLKTMLSQAPPAEAAWRDGRAQLAEREKFRPEDRTKYRNEIVAIYNADANVQLQEIVIGMDGQPTWAADARAASHKQIPTFRPAFDRFAQPLRSLVVTEAIYVRNKNELEARHIELEKLVTKDADLTAYLTGGTLSNGMTIEKGLRKRIEDERLKMMTVLEEFDVVKPLLIKTYGDGETLLARRRQLEKRIKELEASPITPN